MFAARRIRSNVPGVHIPDHVIARLEGADDQKREGKEICIELIQQIREVPSVSGVHVMAYRQEHLVTDIIRASKIFKNRIINSAAADQAARTEEVRCAS
jgi:methylenetetrahydrofolate reductase (NADPH)